MIASGPVLDYPQSVFTASTSGKFRLLLKTDTHTQKQIEQNFLLKTRLYCLLYPFKHFSLLFRIFYALKKLFLGLKIYLSVFSQNNLVDNNFETVFRFVVTHNFK